MQKLPSGSYIVLDPSTNLQPKDYRRMLRRLSEEQKEVEEYIEFAVLSNDDGNMNFAVVSCEKGVYYDQYGSAYETNGDLVLVPVEMVSHLDFAQLETIYFSEDFYAHLNGGVFHANHIQIKVE